jgi:hypothetical protein
VVRAALAAVARPFKPNESASDYLRELFFEVLEALQGRPTIARMAVLRLMDDPILVPPLAERMLSSLAALGVPPQNLPAAFRQTLGALFEMVLSVSARSNVSAQKRAAAQIDKAISALSPTEFSNLDQLRPALVDEAALGATETPLAAIANFFADRLIKAIQAQ